MSHTIGSELPLTPGIIHPSRQQADNKSTSPFNDPKRPFMKEQ